MVHISDNIADVVGDTQYYWRRYKHREVEGDLFTYPIIIKMMFYIKRFAGFEKNS